MQRSARQPPLGHSPPSIPPPLARTARPQNAPWARMLVRTCATQDEQEEKSQVHPPAMSALPARARACREDERVRAARRSPRGLQQACFCPAPPLRRGAGLALALDTRTHTQDVVHSRPVPEAGCWARAIPPTVVSRAANAPGLEARPHAPPPPPHTQTARRARVRGKGCIGPGDSSHSWPCGVMWGQAGWGGGGAAGL